ncbi:MAG: hypothetical protein QHH13_06595 [Melioribacter sp.]|uniref:hypothetical protein n=1 Tax=Rosettibacter primus TaxID=3111523 RepID=UPI00247B4EDB|nr:hypothetical protein [Melioribacter sp.]
MSENTITLYPSNWLYNAGVVGLLNSIEKVEQLNVNDFLIDAGGVIIRLPFFNKLNVQERYFSESKISSLVGKNRLYKNFLQSTQKNTFIEFVKRLDKIKSSGSCHICYNPQYLSDSDINKINEIDPGKAKFLNRIEKLNMVQNSEFGPTENEFPNGFWNMKQSLKVCHLCNFILIHHHLALTKLSDNSEIFINVPSFKVMFELNKIVKETYGSLNSEEARNKREILATSVIEYSRKLQSTIGLWSGMNIEIVIKSKKGIDFFSLPYDTIKIISDRKIASALSDLGEFRILNNILDKNYSQLIDISYKLIRIGLKNYNDRSKNENNIVNDLLSRDINRKNISKAANKILMLYSLIEEKLKRS